MKLSFYELVYDIEKPDLNEYERIIDFQKAVIDTVRESNKALKEENKKLKEALKLITQGKN